MKAEQILQDHLERLEAGESLETILTDVPEEEGDLLYLAAQILAIPKPERNPAIVKKQHQKVIQAVKQNRTSSPRAVSNPFLLKWLIPVGVALVLFVTLASFWQGMVSLNNQKNLTPNSIVFSNTNLPEERATEPVLGGTLIFEQLPTPTSAPNAQTASLMRVHGIIQVQNESGDWLTIQTAELKVGQTFRTWNLSSAQLVFFDGSMVTLGPNAQLTIETLNAQKAGTRQISLFQSSGETIHSVAPSTDVSSSYVVHTPYASGEARGTTFRVSVSMDKNSSFAVVEGEVAVTGQQTTVSVTPGQITFVEEASAPIDPVFWLTTQGEVTQIGEFWVIGGEIFQIHEATLIDGAPEIGDSVLVVGRLLSDGTRLADRIELQAPAIINQFKILGIVEEMGGLTWTVSGQEILVNETTQVDTRTEVGSQVFVRGVVQNGGTLLGTQFQLVEENSRFEFTGLIEEIAGQNWTVSSVLAMTNAETEISGNPITGDLVHVKGLILPDGTWLAREIEKVTEINSFEFTGTIEAIDPWGVNGVSLGVNAQTQISPNAEIGTLVRVGGVILENGTWLANEILTVNDEPGMLVFVGVVESVTPWIVNGIPLNVPEDTVIIGDITIASLVRVYIRIQEDGVWQVRRIELIEPAPITGCVEFSDILVSFDETDIVLQNGITIPRGVVEISGELIVGGQVLVQICYTPENEIIFASITVIDDGIEPTPVPEPTDEGKVTICHNPSGDPNKANTITVDASAVDAHLNHGDYLGPCQENSGNDNGNGNGNGNKDDDKGNGNNK